MAEQKRVGGGWKRSRQKSPLVGQNLKKLGGAYSLSFERKSGAKTGKFRV